MGYGLPIVMTDVGGNAEAAAGYGGIVLVPPGDPAALRTAIETLQPSDVRHEHPHSWEHTAERYNALFDSLLGADAAPGSGPTSEER
jgi:glycosyltransferase involved in cell wall biosynthesis